MDDDKIVELFLNKDESAIAHTAKKYGFRLCSISQRITADLSVAEECENDTYLEAWNRIPECVLSSTFFDLLTLFLDRQYILYAQRKLCSKPLTSILGTVIITTRTLVKEAFL